MLSRRWIPVWLCILASICSTVAAASSGQENIKSGNLSPDNIRLASLSAAVIDLETAKPLLQKHSDIVVPIASITKIMSAMVLLDGKQDLDEKLTISREGFSSSKNAYSRLRPGSKLARGEMLQISLMSSENLATFVLAANYPGGVNAFIKAMNDKAKQLGMTNSTFTDPTGLSTGNQSTAMDLVRMARAAMKYALIQEYSTTDKRTVTFSHPRYHLNYRNTNPLVRKGEWDIALSKTGYLSEAGRCLIMLTEISGRRVAMVLLDSYGKRTPVGDAGRIKRWLTTGEGGRVSKVALRYERQKLQTYNIDLASAQNI